MEKIYFIEDDENIRKLVCYALSREGYAVSGFSMFSEFYPVYKEQSPDLLLLDIMLPEEDGLSILTRIRRCGDLVPVIMITAKDSEFDKVKGLDLGADDYLTKPFGMTELVSRVKAVLRRSSWNAQRRTDFRIGELAVDTQKHTVQVSGREVPLSFKEFSLLTSLLEANGRVLTREELFLKVWGEYYGESRTLDVHIRNLRSKLETAGKYIQTVKNVGYKIGGEGIE